MYYLGIIGTAGRGDDRAKLSSDVFNVMRQASRDKVRSLQVTHGVSGGAAWADHCIVRLGLEGYIDPKNITLFLPEEIDYTQKRYVDKGFRSVGSTANYYMSLFYQKTGISGVAEIIELGEMGATLDCSTKGFKQRNTRVAQMLTPEDKAAVLAWTYGTANPASILEYPPETSAMDAGLKDGGTADTWNKCRCRKFHGCLTPVTSDLNITL